MLTGAEVAQIYGAGATNWQSNAWLSVSNPIGLVLGIMLTAWKTTISFGIWGGIVGFGAVFHLVKHIRYQLIFYMLVTVAFSGALASSNPHNKSQSAAFSFLATVCVGMLEVTPGVLVQLDADDADLGTVFSAFQVPPRGIRNID